MPASSTAPCAKSTCGHAALTLAVCASVLPPALTVTWSSYCPPTSGTKLAFAVEAPVRLFVVTPLPSGASRTVHANASVPCVAVLFDASTVAS